MMLLLHFVALLFYISAINSSDFNDSENTVLSLIGDFPKAKPKIDYRIPVETKKIPIRDNDKERGFSEHQNTFVKFIQNNVKLVTGKDSYKDVMLSLKKHDETDQRPKLHESIKKYIQEPHKHTLNELIQSGESDKIITNSQVLLQHLNNKRDRPNNQNSEYYQKLSKAFLLSQPNENIVFAVKPQYRQFDPNNNKKDQDQDITDAQNKAKIIHKVKVHEEKLDELELPSRIANFDNGKERFKMDRVLNILKKIERRKGGTTSDSDESTDKSSSLEEKDWKDEFKELYMKKKYEALNATTPAGDKVNMVAARPWGVPCGDPNQHDMPWGSCTMAAECEPEFRIFRGDHLCGRQEFICCAIKLKEYDLYDGFDASFNSKSLSTDSQEHTRSDKDKKGGKKKRNKNSRKRKDRQKRKREIKKRIRKIKKEINKLLNKEYKKGTKDRKKKTKTLKKFIKKIKKQYKKDRKIIRDIHAEAMITIDANLMKKLNQIMKMNENFIKNDTFREIVVNGTLTKTSARMLVEAYPDMQQYLPKILRRFDLNDNFVDYLEYDLEYGYLYH